MARGTWTVYPGKWNKGLSSTFQPPEEGRSVQPPKRCNKHDDKDKSNIPKNINNVQRSVLENVMRFCLDFTDIYNSVNSKLANSVLDALPNDSSVYVNHSALFSWMGCCLVGLIVLRCVNPCRIILSYLPNPSARAGYGTRSIFKRS